MKPIHVTNVVTYVTEDGKEFNALVVKVEKSSKKKAPCLDLMFVTKGDKGGDIQFESAVPHVSNGRRIHHWKEKL